MSGNWEKHFDQIYCLHFLGQTEKFPRIKAELARVGILDSGIFEFRYTSPSPYDNIVWEKEKGDLAPKPLFVNICLEIRKCLAEAIAFGYKRILLLENDICFLKDLDELEKGFAATPADFGVVQYDKFVHKEVIADYKDRLANKMVNDLYFDGRGGFFPSAACMGLFDNGISEMLRVMDKQICATDIAPQLMNCRYAVAAKNLAVQVFYAKSNSIDDYGSNFMHAVYKNAGIDYNDYAVPDGYGYGKVVDKTGRAVAGNNDDSDKRNCERKPTSFRGGIASALDKGTKNLVNYKQSGAGAASDAKQKGGEASCPKDESASRRKFSGESTESHELQPWVAHEFLNHVENDKPLVCKGRKKISVYAIAKNEAKHVARWVDCMKEADEICVLDTGSTDDTVKLLRERGVKVAVKKYDEFLFDRARNDARKLASKDAEILFAIDLDETIAPGWRKILEDAWIAAENRGISPAYAVYKFKTNLQNGEITYINKIHAATEGTWLYGIHEVLKYDRQDHIDLPEEFCLEHHPDAQKSRGQYLGMLKSAVREMPDSARLRLYYGRELANHGHLDEALKEFEDCLERSDRAPCDIDSVQRAVVMYYMAKIYQCKKNLENAEMWCLRSVLEYRRRDNCFFLGRLYDAMNQVRLANSAYEKALTIKERQSGYPEEPEAWNGLLYGCYSKTLWALGRLEESLRMAQKAHCVEPENQDYINLLNEINQKMPHVAAK